MNKSPNGPGRRRGPRMSPPLPEKSTLCSTLPPFLAVVASLSLSNTPNPPLLTAGMELELEAGGGGGRVVCLSSESPATDLGSGDLVPAPAPRADRTVSRRHVSLRLVGDGGEPRVSFEVVGRNPVVVRSSVGAEKVYRRGEAGELREGDGLSLSLKAPSFWAVRRTGVKGEEEEVDAAVLDAVARREKRTRERKEKERERQAVEEAMEVADGEETTAALGNEELEDLKIDLQNIDPVQEFGFLSMGHEFYNYPKGRIRAPKDWNWFLEETKKSSDDEDDDDDDVRNTRRKSRGGSHVNKKKKKKGDDEDEEWTDESEDGKDSQQSGPSAKRPKKYGTRSKDPKKPRKENSDKTEKEDTADDETEDEEDETVGGFIVQEEDEAMEELSEEEEDEFDDEDEDD